MTTPKRKRKRKPKTCQYVDGLMSDDMSAFDTCSRNADFEVHTYGGICVGLVCGQHSWTMISKGYIIR
jgi:hypothetical protein